MKTVQNLAVLLLALIVAAFCVAGFLHNFYMVAVFAEPLFMEVLRAIGIIVFPLGILLGFM